MKKKFSVLLCTFLVVNMGLVFSFGEVTPASVGNAISPGDVSRGLLFCRDYPVTVQIDGKTVRTVDRDVPPVIIGERTLIPVRAFFEAMGATVDWNEENKVVTIENDGLTVELAIDSSVTKVDGIEKMLEVPAMIIDHDEDGTGSTMVPLRFVSEGLGREVSWEESTRTANVTVVGVIPEEEPENIPDIQIAEPFMTAYGMLNRLNDKAGEKLIVIDIGHGGRDSGAVAHEDMPDELYEKDVNLEVGLRLKDLLEQAGARVLFTRESDLNMGLYERPALANNWGADLFVSLHNNSSDQSGPKGTEVYYYSKVNGLGQSEKQLYGIASFDVATRVQQEMVSILGTNDRGVSESQYLAILNKSSMPAIVIEGSFMSNSEDLERIRTQEYKAKYAYAVAKGLITAMNSAF